MGWEYTSGLLQYFFPSPVFYFASLSVSSSVPLSLSSVSSVSHPLSISARLPSTEEWFHVQLNLSKAINTRSVMIPAALQMELLILLSLLPPPPPHLLPPFSSPGTILVDSFLWTRLLALPLLSVCCRCRAVAPTKIEMKKNKNPKKMKKQTGLSEAGKARTQSYGMDHS